VDRTNHHLFQPLLYRVATGILPDGLIAPALRNVIKDQTNARALLAGVVNIDLDGRRVSAVGPDGKPLALAYDTSSWQPGLRTRTSGTTSGPSSLPA
jgi:NADH:ubiquinone reductase (H+-translocating)